MSVSTTGCWFGSNLSVYQHTGESMADFRCKLHSVLPFWAVGAEGHRSGKAAWIIKINVHDTSGILHDKKKKTYSRTYRQNVN